MSQAAIRPVRQAAIRRALAWALALLANGALIAIILVAPRPPPAPANPGSIDLILVTLPTPLIEPAERPAEIDAPPPPQPDPAAALETVDRTADEAPLSADPDDDGVMMDESPADVSAAGLPDYEIIALPRTSAPSGTASFIRDIFCQTASDATREAGDCPHDAQADGLSMTRYATAAGRDEALQAALGIGLTAGQIRALFQGNDLGLADLSGQSTLADTAQRPTSSADQMRDSLPPQHPDPAFGD